MGVITGVIGGVFCLLCYLPVSYSNGECIAPLGVEDDSGIQLEASSETGMHSANDGRLNGPKAWRPKGNSVAGEWIQATFGTLVNVTNIATQGRNPMDGRMPMNENEYVTQYKVQYSNDENSLMYIRNANNTADMIFTGNENRSSIERVLIPNAVLLTRFRIEIVQCSEDGCALRFELYGCQEHPCKNQYGLTSDPTDCTSFYICADNTPEPTQCGPGTYFDPLLPPQGSCDYLRNAPPGCPETQVSTPAYTTISSTSTSRNPVSTPASTTISSTSISRNPEYTPASTTAEEYTLASATISPASISRRSNPGAVAGSVICVLLVIVIIIIVVIWLLKRKRETAKSTPQSGQAFDGPYELTIEGNNGPAKTQPTLVDEPNQDEYAYVDVNKANTPQNEVKPDTGDIYQDVQDKPDEYAYAYADVNESKTSDEPSDDGLVHIYAKSKHGGRPITKDQQNPAADTGDIYQSIQEAPNEKEYAHVDVKVDANGKPVNPQEGWEDNVIYAAGNDDEGIAADKGKEGWVDNNIYATTDNDAQNAEGKSQVDGWEDNIIYGDK